MKTAGRLAVLNAVSCLDTCGIDTTQGEFVLLSSFNHKNLPHIGLWNDGRELHIQICSSFDDRSHGGFDILSSDKVVRGFNCLWTCSVDTTSHIVVPDEIINNCNGLGYSNSNSPIPCHLGS